MNWEKDEIRKSRPCNGEFLKHLRERKNWTQDDLAKAAGYSQRLISKAESGRPISTAAIEVLAEALSDNEETWVASDLTSDPLSMAKQYIAALYTKHRDVFELIQPILHEKVEFHIAGDPEFIPFAGIHRGIPGIRRALEILFSVLESPEDHDYRPWYTFIAQGNEAFVWGKTWIHPIGRPFDEPLDIQNRFVFQEGKLILFEDRFDTARGMKSLMEQ